MKQKIEPKKNLLRDYESALNDKTKNRLKEEMEADYHRESSRHYVQRGSRHHGFNLAFLSANNGMKLAHLCACLNYPEFLQKFFYSEIEDYDGNKKEFINGLREGIQKICKEVGVYSE